MSKGREYCCCAIPLVNAGIYITLAEQTVLGIIIGALSLATPSSKLPNCILHFLSSWNRSCRFCNPKLFFPDFWDYCFRCSWSPSARIYWGLEGS